MSKFTPGPWAVNTDESGYYIDKDDLEIAKVQNKANARLIAAAPEMYELLRRIHDNMVLCDVDVTTIRTADWMETARLLNRIDNWG